MESFVKFLYELLAQFFGGFWKAIAGVFGGAFDLVNIPAYAELVETYNGGFGVGGWILAILCLLVLVAILVAIVVLAVILIKKKIDNKNKLIDIVEVNEVIGYNEYSNAVLLPPETSYARFVLRKADSLYASKEIVAVYPLWQYIVCASVVALATACESAIIYLLSRNLMLNALRLKIALSSPILMLIFTVAISLIVAGLTVLAYRRKCKKVINR